MFDYNTSSESVKFKELFAYTKFETVVVDVDVKFYVFIVKVLLWVFKYALP